MFSFLPLLLAVMGWDDALIIGGISAAAGASSAGLSSWLGNRNAKKNSSRDAKLTYKYNLKLAENYPSSQVKGLRAAGLNPILAATDGAFSTPSMPSVSSDTSNNGSAGFSAGTNAVNMALQAKQINSNVETQETVSQLNKASAFEKFVNGMNELKKGGHSGVFGAGYEALKSIGTGLGLTSDESSSVLKMFGLDFLPKSSPNTPTKSTAEIKSRNHPLDNTSSVRDSSRSRDIAFNKDKAFDKKLGLDKSKWWQSLRNKEREMINKHDSEFEKNYNDFHKRFFKHK